MCGPSKAVQSPSAALPIDTPRWQAIANECSLAADQIGEGATQVRRLRHTEPHTIMRVLFPLSVGLERACKILLHCESLVHHRALLDMRTMRNLGHNLGSLVTSLESHNRERNRNAILPDSAIHTSLLAILTEFATGGRYHSLDYLASGASGTLSPASSFWSAVVVPIADQHCQKKIELAGRTAKEFDAMIGEHTQVVFTSVQGEPVRSVHDAVLGQATFEAAQPWIRMYVLQIARWIYETASEISSEARALDAADVPHLSEFFAHFGNEDHYFRSRRTWMPVG